VIIYERQDTTEIKIRNSDEENDEIVLQDHIYYAHVSDLYKSIQQMKVII
jgi:hypothetical protein